MELYGKLNKEKIVNDYTPLQSSTTELSIDNEKYTIQANVRKVPNKINISMEDGKYLGSFDGSSQTNITIPTIAGPQGPQGEKGQDGKDGEQGPAGKDGKQGENGLSALMLKNIYTTNIAPTINLATQIDENLFSRTPVYGEYITFIWLNNSTNKSYAVSGQILSYSIEKPWAINVLSFTEVTGESALVSNVGPYWAGDVTTPPLTLTLINSSFNRNPSLNDTFTQVVNKGVSGSVPGIVWLCTYKVSVITVEGQVSCGLVGYSQISALPSTIIKQYETFEECYNDLVSVFQRNPAAKVGIISTDATGITSTEGFIVRGKSGESPTISEENANQYVLLSSSYPIWFVYNALVKNSNSDFLLLSGNYGDINYEIAIAKTNLSIGTTNVRVIDSQYYFYNRQCVVTVDQLKNLQFHICTY